MQAATNPPPMTPSAGGENVSVYSIVPPPPRTQFPTLTPERDHLMNINAAPVPIVTAEMMELSSDLVMTNGRLSSKTNKAIKDYPFNVFVDYLFPFFREAYACGRLSRGNPTMSFVEEVCGGLNSTHEELKDIKNALQAKRHSEDKAAYRKVSLKRMLLHVLHPECEFRRVVDQCVSDREAVQALQGKRFMEYHYLDPNITSSLPPLEGLPADIFADLQKPANVMPSIPPGQEPTINLPPLPTTFAQNPEMEEVNQSIQLMEPHMPEPITGLESLPPMAESEAVHLPSLPSLTDVQINGVELVEPTETLEPAPGPMRRDTEAVERVGPY